MAAALPWIAVGAAGAGTALSAAGSIKSGNAAYQAGHYQAAVNENNARLAESQAQEALDQGKVEEERVRRETAALIGQQRAVLAGLGQALGVGTGADIVADSAMLGEVDAITTRRNASRAALGFRIEAQNFRNEAQLNRMGASSARTAGLLGASGTLLSGIGDAASTSYKFKQTSFRNPTGG